MSKNLRVLFYGFLISFLGSLPLGAMNIMATHIALSNGANDAMVYSFGSMLVEAVYVFFVLKTMGRFQYSKKYFRLFEWATLLTLVGLALGSLHAAYTSLDFGSALPIEVTHPFLTGIGLSAINPLHIIFWLGWSSFLMNKNLLMPTDGPNRAAYILGICMGTMFGFAVYIFGGTSLTKQINNNQNVINWVIGIILLLTAIIQSFKMGRSHTLKTIQ